MSMNALRLAGKIKIGIYDDSDVRGPIIDGGNTTELTLQADGEDIEVISTDYDNHGAALDSMSDPKPTTGTWKINRFTAQTLALACAGAATALTTASAAKTLNTFVATLGEGQRIAERPIDTLVVKDATDATTYAAGTDYEVNEQLAIVTPLIGGTIVDASTLHLSFNETARTGFWEILGSTALGKRIWLGLDGRNLFNNKKVTLIIDKLKLKPSGTLNFIATDPAEQQFDFTCIVPEGETQAYKLWVQD
jgi:hypothetical protein